MASPISIASDEEYRRCMGEAAFWEPHVRAALAQAGLAAPRRLEPGRDCSYPTYIVDSRVVVKLYGDRFGGPRSWAAETEAYTLLAGTDLPVPRILGRGELQPGEEGWRWPFLVMERLPGEPLKLARQQLTRAQLLALTEEVGDLTARLHALPPRGEEVLAPDWSRFLALLRQRRAATRADHERWGHLPAPLVAGIDAILPEDPASLLDLDRPPTLLHGDLHGEHIWVDPATGRLTGILDFTDAHAGDPRYELIALHLDAFGYDRELLAAFLAAYGAPRDPQWAPTALLAFVLLHEFDVLIDLPLHPALTAAASLEDLAGRIWSVNPPFAG